MQKLLTPEEQEKLYAWIGHAATKLSGSNPKAMFVFIKSLVNRQAQKQSVVAYLREFHVEKAEEFADELFQRIRDKNFDFVPDAEPAAPPPKPAPPPKETKPEPEPKPKRTEPPPKPAESKPKRDDSKKPEDKKSRDDDRRKDRDDDRRKDRDDDRRKDRDDRRKDRDDRRKDRKDSGDRRDRRDDYSSRRDKRRRDDSPDRRDDSPDRRDDSPDRRDRRDDRKGEQRRDKWSGFKEKARQRRNKYRDSDEESDKEAEPEVAPPPKYIIYVAGIDPGANTISGLLKLFGKYGRILAIETLVDKNVAFIEYDQLLGAFRAVIAKRNPLGNSFIRIGYATEPDPEALAALQREYEERTRKWNEEKEKKRLEAEAAKQKEKEAAAAKDDDSEMEKKRALLCEIANKQQEAITELEQCTDPEQRKILEARVSELDKLLQELCPDA